jgi:murein DD-endopeptidase MepM/ murein hydrolase activator NlpD
MLIYRSLKTNYISQKFGENKHPLYKKWGMVGHNGTDFIAKDGEPIYWDCFDCVGKVVKLSLEPNEGLGVVVMTEDKDGIFQHRFWHLKDICCEVGQILDSGTLIGHADNTGISTGTHLHRDLKELDPANRVLNHNNGYRGGINLDKYFTNIYIKSYVDNLSGQVGLLKRIIKLITDYL